MLVLREREGSNFSILACSGSYRLLAGTEEPQRPSPELLEIIRLAFSKRQTEFHDDLSILYLRTASETEIVVLLEAGKQPSETDRALVEIFCSRLAVAFDNVVLYERLQQVNSDLDQRVRDRTSELKTANARLRAQWLQARRANAFQREMVGTVAHDIRNPLSVVLGRAEIMKEMIATSEPEHGHLLPQVEYIHTAASRLSKMVDELLGQALSDAMDITIRKERIGFATLVREVIEANLVLANRKNQKIDVSAPTNQISVIADPDRLREAVDNLLSNAIKYSPLGGAISVSIGADERYAALSIKDSGPGLLPDDMRRLFGRFQRLSARPTGGEPSTGLGLSITKKIVDLHDGALLAQSDGAGAGTTVVLQLPLDTEAAE
jgi:signal transduction histidine kinase